MSLTTTATLVYHEDSYGFRFHAGPVVAACDTCPATATATGTERAGAVLERVYGLPGWWLYGPVACPACVDRLGLNPAHDSEGNT